MAMNSPAPDENQDQIPLEATPIAPVVKQTRGMIGSVIKAEEPASITFAALAAREFGKISMEMGLGTQRPPKALVGFDKSRTVMYIAPTNGEDPMGTPVTYQKGRAFASFYPQFAALERLVPAGIREYYDVKRTPDMVLIGTTKTLALYAKLTEVRTESVSPLSEEEKAKRKAKRQQRKANQAQTANGESAASSDSEGQ